MRYSELLAQLHHPRETALEAAPGQIEYTRDDLRLLSYRVSVVGHDVGQDDCIGEPVMRVEPRADRMRYRMHAAQTFLKSRGAHRRCGQHLCARFDVLAVGTGARQEPMNEPHALECDTVRQRMESWRTECLETVDKRVNAGGSGHRARQSDR